jgi:hypothetical protein
MIQPHWERRLHAVIGNLINESGWKSIIINGAEDPIHCFSQGWSSVEISERMNFNSVTTPFTDHTCGILIWGGIQTPE